MSNFIRKLTSRKLWMAILGVTIGVAMAFGVEGETIVEIVSLVSGALVSVGSICGFMKAESTVDAASASAKGTIEQPANTENSIVGGE